MSSATPFYLIELGIRLRHLILLYIGGFC